MNMTDQYKATVLNTDALMNGWMSESDMQYLLEEWDDLKYHPDRYVNSFQSTYNDPNAVGQQPEPLEKRSLTIQMYGETGRDPRPDRNPYRQAYIYFDKGYKTPGMNGVSCRALDITLSETVDCGPHLKIQVAPDSYSDPDCICAQIGTVIWIGVIPADRIKLKEDLKEDRT